MGQLKRLLYFVIGIIVLSLLFGFKNLLVFMMFLALGVGGLVLFFGGSLVSKEP